MARIEAALHPDMSMGTTQHLGAGICVRLAHVNLLIFDSLGCAIFCIDLPWSCILIDRLRSLGGSRACTICGNVPPSCCTPQSRMVRSRRASSFTMRIARAFCISVR
jgi:hypothetical protein